MELPSNFSIFRSICKSFFTIIRLIFEGIFYGIVKLFLFWKHVKPEGKAIFITGCDSGFGNATARKLDAKGFHVFAACLFPLGPGATQLSQETSEHLKIVGLDVTSEESVLKALEFVKNNLGHCNLWAVINNAGIYKGLAVELSSLQEFRDCMEVNAFGPIRVTKAFLPLIRKVKGRVVNVTSYGGRMAVPHMTPYIVSKFAAVAFNDCLRREMVDWGVRVISIEPEAFNTPMANNETRIKTFDEEIASLDSTIIDDYGLEYFKQYRKMMLMGGDLVAPNIYRVVDALYSAVSSKYPDSIYMPCRNYLTELCNVLAINSPVCMQDFGTQIFSAFVNMPKPKGATEDFEEVFSEKNLTK